MLAPKWARGPRNLAHFPSWDPCITPGYWAGYLNVLPTSGSPFRSLFMRSCPERAYILAFLPLPPSSPQWRNPVTLHFFAYAEIIFAHILVFPACAIEVQHINENPPTSSIWLEPSPLVLYGLISVSSMVSTCTKLTVLKLKTESTRKLSNI